MYPRRTYGRRLAAPLFLDVVEIDGDDRVDARLLDVQLLEGARATRFPDV